MGDNKINLSTIKDYKIPFAFVLDNLSSREVIIKPMFGCYGLYMSNKMYFLLRNRTDKKNLNGIWLAVASTDDYNSLKVELPSINQDKVLIAGSKSNNKWLLLSVFDEHFEELANNACTMILSNDDRLGRITKGALLSN